MAHVPVGDCAFELLDQILIRAHDNLFVLKFASSIRRANGSASNHAALPILRSAPHMRRNRDHRHGDRDVKAAQRLETAG
jgi:hypothetical protein